MPFNIESLRPADTPEYMTSAWISCILWAASEPSLVAQFRSDTGCAWIAPTNGFERMIDQATGAGQGFVEAFVKWVNENVWGPIDGPTEDPS